MFELGRERARQTGNGSNEKRGMDARHTVSTRIERDELHLHTNKAHRSHKMVQLFELLRTLVVSNSAQNQVADLLLFPSLSLALFHTHTVDVFSLVYFQYFRSSSLNVGIFLFADNSNGTTNTNRSH